MDPPRTVRFPPPSRVSALFFLHRNPRQSRPEALLEGSKNFRESAFSGTFSTPHTFCTPPYHGPSKCPGFKTIRFGNSQDDLPKFDSRRNILGNFLSVPDVSRERRCLQTSLEQLMATKHKKGQKIGISVPGRLGSFSVGETKIQTL